MAHKLIAFAAAAAFALCNTGCITVFSAKVPLSVQHERQVVGMNGKIYLVNANNGTVCKVDEDAVAFAPVFVPVVEGEDND